MTANQTSFKKGHKKVGGRKAGVPNKFTGTVKEVFLEVRKSNLEAINFYKKYNFKQIGVRKDYYKDPIENALVFGLYLKY